MTATLETGARRAGQFDHLGLLYRDREEYAARIIAFVREGLAAGEPVLVATPGQNLDLIRTGLGEDAAGVRFTDMALAGRNPGRIIPRVLLAFAAAHPDQRVRIVGEPIWRGRSDLEYPACAAHEAAINAVFADHDAAILCPYDAAGLPDDAVADAARTHPLMIDGAGVSASPDYIAPDRGVAMFNRPLPDPPATAAILAYSGEAMLRQVRHFVANHAAAAGLSPERVDALCVAVNELASNTCDHTGGPGQLSMWVEPDILVCQVDDHGTISDPLIGRIPPDLASTGGRGLFIVHVLCDLVRIYTRPHGTSIRVHIDR
jgi:anti-sigma regulatory factor (Ser/Thr protein kinase)